MKKTGKLVILFLVLAMLCGVFAVASSADYSKKILIDDNCDTGETASGRIHTNEMDGNSYLSYIYTASRNYYDFGATQGDAFDGTWAYLTLDFDLMTETTYESGKGTNLYFMTRGEGGSARGTHTMSVSSNADGIAQLTAITTNETFEIPGDSYSWVHITYVLQIDCKVDNKNVVEEDNSVLLTYVNGKLAFTQKSVLYKGSLNLVGFRIQSFKQAVSDATVCIDNVKMAIYGKDYDGNLTGLFDGNEHSLEEAEYDVAYHKGYKFPYGRTRAGVYNLAGYETAYDSVQAAFDAAKDGYEVKLYDDASNVTITSAVTVNANGHRFTWKPGDFALSTFDRDGNTIYSFRKTDRFAYFTFYPDGPYGEPEGEDIPVPIGALPIYEGTRLQLVFDDANGYHVFKEWLVFGESPLTAVTAGEIYSHFDLYPSYVEKKAPTTGKIVYSNDCESDGMSHPGGADATYGKSGIAFANGNGYYRYYATLDASGNSNPKGSGGYMSMPFGQSMLENLSYFAVEFDISFEDVVAEGSFNQIGRNSGGNSYYSTLLTVARKNGKMVLSMGGRSVEFGAGEWAHVTLVSQSRGKTGTDLSTALFINGERIVTLSQNYWNEIRNPSIVKIDDYRFIPASNNPEGATLCFDNVTLQTFDKAYNGSLSELFDNQMTNLNQKMYRDVMWSTEYELPKSPAARVNGVEYGSVTEALAVLREGGTLELLRNLTNVLVIDRPMTLVMNGFTGDFTHEGFDAEDKGNGTYVFTRTVRKAYYTFYNLDGTVLVKDVPALYGSMPSPGIGFTAAVELSDGTLHIFKEWVRDRIHGIPLTKVTAADIDRHFDVYPESETVRDYCAYLYSRDGKVTVLKEESQIPAALTGARNDTTFVFACDYYVEASISVGNVYIDLNGHTITSNGNADVAKYSPFQITATTRLYSSKKGGYLRIVPVVIDGKEQSYAAKDKTTPAIFDKMKGELILGTVYNPTLDKTFKGENLTMSGGCLINSEFDYPVTIDGGHYFATLNDFKAPIITRTGLKDFRILNAEIYTTRSFISFQNANGAEIHIKNCRIHMGGKGASFVTKDPGATGADPSGTVYMTNTEVYDGNVNVAGAKGRIVIGEGCLIPAIGSSNTKLVDGLITMTKTTHFVPSEELTKFLGKTIDATSSIYTEFERNFVTVIWQDGTIGKWLVGTVPTRNGLVIEGWLFSTDDKWIFKDAKGNLLTFDAIPDSLKGATIYAEANHIGEREKEVYATISYFSTVEYICSESFSEIGKRLEILGANKANGRITVTFCRNMTGTVGINTSNKENVVDIYIDLNGHSITTSNYFYSFKGTKSYYIYSSKKGAAINADGNLILNYSRGGSHVYIGTVKALDGNIYVGDNLTIYAARLYDNGKSQGTIYTYNLHVDGGIYYVKSAITAMNDYGSVNITLENATIFTNGCVMNVKSECTGNLTASKCKIYLSMDASFVGTDEGTGSLNISDSLVYGAAVGKAGSFILNLSGNVSLTHMPSGFTTGNELCVAHAPTVTFTDGNGKTHTYTVAYRTAKLTDVVTVEWKSGAVSSKDYWLPGTTITCANPVVFASIDTSDDRYAFIPNGEWIYVMNGGIITNLAVEDYMAGAGIVATARVNRVRMSFVVIRPDGKIEAYTETDFATFKKAVEAITDASRVIMHTDYDIPNAELYLNGNGIELDINGHTYTTSTKVEGRGNLIDVASGKTAYVYSSKPGAYLRSNTGGFAMMVSENSTLKVGTDAKGTVYDRENFRLSGTCAILVLNGTAYFSNITYLADVSDNTGLFQFKHSIGKLTIDNCFIASEVKAILGARSGNGFTATIKNSEIYIKGGFALTDEYHKDNETASSGTATIENTLIFAETGKFNVHAQFPVTFGAGCRFVTDAKVANTTFASDDLVYARVAPTEMAITIFNTTYRGTLLYETCASADTATVTWKNGTSETKELWKKGEIPTNDTEIPTGDKYITGIYRYDTPLTGDVAISPTFVFLLPMKENLTLTANFTYNLYIPADATVITGVTLGGKEYTLDSTVTLSDGKSYYVISYADMTPRDAANDISLVISAKSSDGTEYEKTMTLSVCAYAEKLLAGDPSKETEQLVVDMLAYIRAAYCYFTPAADRDTARVDALLEGRTPSTPDYSEQVADLGTLSKVLFGASLSLDDTPAFAFRVKSDFRGILTVSYTDNSGKEVSHNFNYTEGGDAYILVTMSVADMRKPLTLTAKDTDGSTVIAKGSYDLDTYVVGIKADFIPDFAARLYAYAASAEDYVKAGKPIAPSDL